MQPSLEDQCRQLLTSIPHWARHYWNQADQCCDLSEYEDAGREALCGCLARWDAAKARFTTYAEYRIRGAMRDCLLTYQHWKYGRYLEGPRHTFHPDARHLHPRSWDEQMLEHLELQQRCAGLSTTMQTLARAIWEGETGRTFTERSGGSGYSLAYQCWVWRQQHAALS